MDKTISLTGGGDGSDFLLQVHDELQHPEVSVDIDAIITRPFRIYQLDQKDSVALEDFPAALQGGKHLLRTGQCPLFMLETGSCWTRIHDRGNVAAQCNPGNRFCFRPPVFLSGRCDISAERFVARQSRWADAACNEEAAVSRLRFHAPMHCIGETHVPVGIF